MPPETATAAAPARTATRELFYAEALNEALAHEMARDERVLVFGEDVAQHGGAFGVTKGLLERFGARRVRNTPISDDNPVIFLEHKLLYRTKGVVPEGEHVVPIGAAEVKRAGTDLTIVTWSREVLFALEAAAKLAEEGIDAEVVDLRTLVPLDTAAILASVRKTHRVLVVHEAIKRAGYGAEIAALIAEEAFDDLDAPPRRLAGVDTPIPYAAHLEKTVVPQVEDIVRAAKELVG